MFYMPVIAANIQKMEFAHTCSTSVIPKAFLCFDLFWSCVTILNKYLLKTPQNSMSASLK
jgi:hypothetical protein